MASLKMKYFYMGLQKNETKGNSIIWAHQKWNEEIFLYGPTKNETERNIFVWAPLKWNWFL